MKMKETGWSYYVKEHGETASDASPLRVYDWQCLVYAEDAAEHAAEDDWDNRDGWEAGVGEGPVITVISPDGEETSFSTEREAVIQHSASPITKGPKT